MAASSSPSLVLPPDLFQTFKAYKNSTQLVVDWLCCNSNLSANTNLDIKLTVKDLYHSATQIKQSGITIPDDISNALLHAIQARWEVTAFFRGQLQGPEQSSEGHEYFTTVLQSIHDLLFESTKPVEGEGKLQQIEAEDPAQGTIFSANTYAPLTTCTADEELEEFEDFNHQILSEIKVPTPQEQHSEQSVRTRRTPISAIVDDRLFKVMSSLLTIQTLDRTLEFVTSLWKSAANEATPLPFLGFVSVYTYLLIQIRFGEAECSELENFNQQLGRVKPETLRFLLREVSTPDGSVFLKGPGLQLSLRAWDRFKMNVAAEQTNENPTAFIARHQIQMEDFANEDTHHKIDKEMTAMLAFLHGAQRWKHRSGFTPELCQQINPLLKDIQTALNGDQGPSTALAFGVQLMTEIHRSQLWGSNSQPNREDCRLTALRFANDVLKSVKLIAEEKSPCPCPDCESSGFILEIGDLGGIVEPYSKVVSFDLYSRNPWVAGTHMYYLMLAASNVGLQLCDVNNYLGALLHMYNALRQLGKIENAIPILEKLCAALDPHIFSGGPRPVAKYYTRFMMFCGVELKTPKASKKKKGKGKPQSHEWEHQKPDYMSKHGKPAGVLQPKKLSIIHTLTSPKAGMTTVHQSFWLDRVYKKPQANFKDRKAILTEVCELDPTKMLEKLADAIKPEFVGDTPILTINWLAVFTLCVDAFAGMMKDEVFLKAWTIPSSGSPDHGDKINIPLVVDWIKWALCEIDNDRPCKFLELAKKNILRVTEGKEVSNFLWKV